MPSSDDVRQYLHDGQYGTGMLYRPEDPLNALMTSVRDIRANLISGTPDRDERLAPQIQYTYNQGSSPSCVWHALSGQQTANERIERHGEQIIFDAMAMHLATGPANEGRYTGDMLKIAQDDGILVAGQNKRYKVGSYAFAPKDTPQLWEDTLKAAIYAGHICGLALLLPSTFGWESSGSIMPNSYHEVLIVGYRPGAFLIKNSWGAGWGQIGFGWVPIPFLTQSNYQNGYVFANTILDAVDPDIQPLPPNPPNPPEPPNPPVINKRYVVTATATGVGKEALAKGVTLTATGGGFTGSLGITGVAVYDDTDPNPPNPPEPPNPPTPGDLQVSLRIYRASRSIYCDVTATGPESISANLTWNVLGMLPTQVLVNGGLVRGRLANVMAGMEVTVRAVQGIHSGQASERVPA